jgi:hypothetical protein
VSTLDALLVEVGQVLRTDSRAMVDGWPLTVAEYRDEERSRVASYWIGL